mmetsp:Transcript_52361/g.120360  ORF Transcript_52361/g.120360 Transcript_52361/m.120360 type:complete len:135 (+) Transcript_52361:1-405(+)
MRSKMNGMMKIPTEKPGDVTYKDVSSFMVPGMFDPNDKEKWALFLSHRPYCVPGYKSKAPAIGKKVPDGPLLSLEEGGPSSTLLAEAKKACTGHWSIKGDHQLRLGDLPILASLRGRGPLSRGAGDPHAARVHP